MMSNANGRFGAMVAAVGLLLAAPSLTGSAAAADSAAVATLLGSWSGSGRITYTDGSAESLRCTGYYTGGGNELRMAIQCQSDKNPIHIRSRLRIDGSRASGDWEERTFNASGTVSGSAGTSSISLSIAGGPFSGSMSVSYGKSSHSVSVSTQGIAMSKVTISFSKR